MHIWVPKPFKGVHLRSQTRHACSQCRRGMPPWHRYAKESSTFRILSLSLLPPLSSSPISLSLSGLRHFGLEPSVSISFNGVLFPFLKLAIDFSTKSHSIIVHFSLETERATRDLLVASGTPSGSSSSPLPPGHGRPRLLPPQDATALDVTPATHRASSAASTVTSTSRVDDGARLFRDEPGSEYCGATTSGTPQATPSRVEFHPPCVTKHATDGSSSTSGMRLACLWRTG
jgi:hypothetical protein